MTKYEWERRLRNSLDDLPSREKDKVFDYYDELFADKIESGMLEEDIIDEFGSPYEVADRIRHENQFGFDDDYYEERPSYGKTDRIRDERERKEMRKMEERERRERRREEERLRKEEREREERERQERKHREEREIEERRREEERLRREERAREERIRREERAERERERRDRIRRDRERRYDDYYDDRPNHIHKSYEWHPTVAGMILGILLVVFVFIPVCAVTFGLFVASIATQIAGVAVMIYSFFGFAFASSTWLCVFGGAIVSIGVGQLMWWAGRTVYRLFKVVVKWLFGYSKCRRA